MKVSIVKISRAIKIKGIKKRKNIYISRPPFLSKFQFQTGSVVIVVIVKSSL